MSDSDQLVYLLRNGYQPREAEFLRLAALSGGYFLRRQFAAFLGQRKGRPSAVLIEKLTAKGHAERLIAGRGTEILWLSPRRFWRLLGLPDHANRKLRSPLAIRLRLMLLDFIIENRHLEVLFLDDEKRDFVSGTLGLSDSLLPWKLARSTPRSPRRRTLRDRFPFVLAEQEACGRPSVLGFTHVDPLPFRPQRFGNYLRRYARFWPNLERFQLIYITTNRRNLAPASRLFYLFAIRLFRTMRPDAAPSEWPNVKFQGHHLGRSYAGLNGLRAPHCSS